MEMCWNQDAYCLYFLRPLSNGALGTCNCPDDYCYTQAREHARDVAMTSAEEEAAS